MKFNWFFPFAFFKPPADQAPAIHPEKFDLGNLPKDLLNAIAESIKDPRDLRSFSLAVSIADVPTKEINDHIVTLLPSFSPSDKEWLRNKFDLGCIWTTESLKIEHYKAIEGKLNPRTNKPFKFDAIRIITWWQDNPVWQSWNWTNVKEVYFRVDSVDPKHAELPLTRLRGLKTISFKYGPANPGYDVGIEVLEQNPDVEILRVSYAESARANRVLVEKAQRPSSFIFNEFRGRSLEMLASR